MLDSEGRELERLPDALARIADEGPGRFAVTGRQAALWGLSARSSPAAIGTVDGRRVERVFRAERRRGPAGYIPGDSLGLSTPVPGLVFSIHYAGRDAHGVTQHLRGLDLAFRRAASTLEALAGGEGLSSWRPAMRPERGGLWIAQSRTGSWECVGTVYGALVSLAYSSPIALASLTSLAWQGAVTVNRAGRWIARRVCGQGDEDPGEQTDVVAWGAGQTKALEPVLLAAIKNGQGFEFESESPSGSVRLRVSPRDEMVDHKDV